MPVMETLKKVCEELMDLRIAVKEYKEKNESINYYENIMQKRTGKTDFLVEIDGSRAMLQFFSNERKEIKDEREKESMLLVIDILQKDYSEFQKLPDISIQIKDECTRLLADLQEMKNDLLGENGAKAELKR